MTERSYHHGDLASTLLTEATAMIAAEGADALSLRRLGERAGVSRTALYRHFRDKSALLAAVAEQGFRLLRERLTLVRAGNGPALERFQAMGLGYIAFAMENPTHYRVMFRADLDRRENPGLAETSTEAFAELLAIITEAQAAGAMRAGAPRELAYAAWSVIHGLAMLGVDRQLPPDLDWRALARSATGALIEGVRAPRDAGSAPG